LLTRRREAVGRATLTLSALRLYKDAGRTIYSRLPRRPNRRRAATRAGRQLVGSLCPRAASRQERRSRQQRRHGELRSATSSSLWTRERQLRSRPSELFL